MLSSISPIGAAGGPPRADSEAVAPDHGAAIETHAGDPTPNQMGAKRYRILVVDDEPAVLRVITKILRRGGYEVVQAPDALTAQDIVRDSEDELDLLITDVMMPRMTGTELAKWLASHAPSIPVLIVSGYAENDLVQEWIDRDPEVFLTKPFQPDQLLERVERRLTAV